MQHAGDLRGLKRRIFSLLRERISHSERVAEVSKNSPGAPGAKRTEPGARVYEFKPKCTENMPEQTRILLNGVEELDQRCAGPQIWNSYHLASENSFFIRRSRFFSHVQNPGLKQRRSPPRTLPILRSFGPSGSNGQRLVHTKPSAETS